jgi:hypothetical protein
MVYALLTVITILLIMILAVAAARISTKVVLSSRAYTESGVQVIHEISFPLF